MKNVDNKVLINIMFIIIFLMSNIVISENNNINTTLDNYDETEITSNEINIKKLQWYSPNGELPGTYKEYLDNHPLSKPIFSSQIALDTCNNLGNSISILIDSSLYPKIINNINEYINDLENEGYSIVLDTISGGNPSDIKNWVKKQYNKDIRGIVFIGDITAAWAEVSESVFPCDLFYMDLDGNWEDNNNDGIYEVHTSGTGDMGPEVYIGRLYASSLNYDSEANMVNDYLEKIHAYRIGELTQPWRGLEYVDEDWYNMDVNLNNIYDQNVSRYDNGFSTTGEDYLNKMDLGQHFVQVCAHSYSGGHHFSQYPTEAAAYAHIYVYSPSNRHAKIIAGSNDGIKIWLNGLNIFTADRYGNWNPNSFDIDIELNKGWNRLLFKISQKDGDYLFSVKITDVDYSLFDDLIYQINNPEIYEEEAQYIKGWLINGFHQDISDNFYGYLTTNYLNTNEATISPYEGDSNGGKTWTEYKTGSDYINLAKYCNDADFGVCYAFVRIYSESDKSCQLWMGYDDGARVWLNSEEVLFDNRYGEFETDMKKVDVNLKSGENRLLIKISEWMGEHGFSARFCSSDGSPIQGLTYDPSQEPIEYISSWLMNGAYDNNNISSRLEKDYLSGEEYIEPSINDSAPVGKWEKAIGDGYPFNIGNFFNKGDWVFSETIQERDPPVLFYNLFSCGPGRFTDEKYLAGSYIFNTTYGLITLASSKSGSMLNFADFTKPLGMGKSIGESFQDWFNAQEPYQLWEKEWYYGMILNGDPTLKVKSNISNPQIVINKPENAIYFRDNKILPFFIPVVIGDITIDTTLIPTTNDIIKVEFFIDDNYLFTDYDSPYEYLLNDKNIGFHTLKVIAYDSSESYIENSKRIMLLNLDL